MKSRKVYFAQIALAGAALALAGCAGMTKKDEDPSVIQEKAVQRWDYLIAGHADKAYDFLSPGYRATVTREGYANSMNNRPVNWEAVKYLDQKCDVDVCTVHVKLKYKVQINLHGMRKIAGDSPVTEKWIKESGRWYYLPEHFKGPKPRAAKP